jgi:hypothetical protein
MLAGMGAFVSSLSQIGGLNAAFSCAELQPNSRLGRRLTETARVGAWTTSLFNVEELEWKGHATEIKGVRRAEMFDRQQLQTLHRENKRECHA